MIVVDTDDIQSTEEHVDFTIKCEIRGSDIISWYSGDGEELPSE